MTVDALTTEETSPVLTGTIDDPTASITVTVNGVDYSATNNGDGTWTLTIGTITDLTPGSYDISVSAADILGNSSTDTTTNELTITQIDEPTDPIDPVDPIDPAETESRDITSEAAPNTGYQGTLPYIHLVALAVVATSAYVATKRSDEV